MKKTSTLGRASRRARHVANHAEQQRQHIALEAARVMAEEGINDFQLAKRRAAARLGMDELKNLPNNQQIEQALREHLQLFHGVRLADQLRRLRTLAVEAMEFLQPFDPRLVGAALSGTATPTCGIQLHITAEMPEDIALRLQEHGIPFQQDMRRVRFGGERYESVPTFQFTADGTSVELFVFNHRDARETPLSPVDGKPMRRAPLKEVRALLAQSPT
jgi:hypothetical protein